MQRVIVLSFILFFLISACAKRKPEGILSETKMTELMTEVELIDAYLNTLPIDSGRKVMPVLYGKTLEEYGLDSATFIRNLDFYSGNAILSEKVFSAVLTNLTEEATVYRLKDSVSQVAQQDSMNRVMYWQDLNNNAQNRILFVHRDTIHISVNEYANYIINHLGIRVLNMNDKFLKPIAPVVVDSVSSVGTSTADSLQKDKPMGVRDSLRIKERAPAPIVDQRIKPVRRSSSLQ